MLKTVGLGMCVCMLGGGGGDLLTGMSKIEEVFMIDVAVFVGFFFLFFFLFCDAASSSVKLLQTGQKRDCCFIALSA